MNFTLQRTVKIKKPSVEFRESFADFNEQDTYQATTHDNIHFSVTDGSGKNYPFRAEELEFEGEGSLVN